MKATLIKKLLCVSAISLTPFLVFAGGTSTDPEGKTSTGYEKNPDKSRQQGDMGTGVGTKSSPSQEQLSDSDLTKKVQEALKNDAQLQKVNIDVKAENGMITLSGDVGDVRWKGRAAKVASSVKGVKSVQNDLTVKN